MPDPSHARSSRPVGLALAVPLALAAGLVPEAAGQFPPFRRLNVDLNHTHAFTLGDLDGDGLPDVVALTVFGGSILINQGTGEFNVGSTGTALLPGGGTFLDFVVVDMDGDGRADVVATNADDSLRLYRGDGTGGISSFAFFEAPSLPAGLAVGDVDQDGDPDVVVTGALADQAQVFLNDGTGQLTPAATLATGTLPTSAALADLDGDGRLDLVVANEHGDSVSLYAGLGGGAFAAPLVRPADQGPSRVKVGDATGDGLPDLLLGTGDLQDDRITILPGLGDGDVGAPLTLHVGGAYPQDPWLADLDEDQVPDIVVPSGLADGVFVLRGLGGGLYAPGTFHPTSDNPQRLAVADVDADGDLDVVATNSSSDLLTVLPGHGDGELGANHATGDEPYDVAAGDLDGDGWPELVAGSTVEAAVAVLPNKGFGRFGPATLHASGLPTEEVELGDLDGDGRLDALVSHGTPSLSWMAGDGALGLAAPVTAAVLAGPPRDLHLADFDGDGRPDLALVADGRTRVLFGAGDGSLGAAVTMTGPSTQALSVGDADGDGALDLVASQDFRVQVNLGDGAGGFGADLFSPNAVQYGYGAALADVDEDGHPDAALLNLFQTVVTFGTGDGHFAGSTTVPDADGISAFIDLADHDGDGHVDLLTGGSQSGTSPGVLTWTPGLGDGSFGAPATIELGAMPRRGTAADLNGDGARDLAWAVADAFVGSGTQAGHVTVQLNQRGPWQTAGQVLAGSHGQPTLLVAGTLVPGSTVELSLAGALEDGLGWLVVGLTALGAPFKGGVLVPSPDLLLPVPLDGEGRAALSVPWTLALPPGATVALQWWVADPAGPAGWSASNGVVGTVP